MLKKIQLIIAVIFLAVTISAQNTIEVSGAGTPEVNGTYIEAGTLTWIATTPYYQKGAIYLFSYRGSNWVIGSDLNALTNMYYYCGYDNNLTGENLTFVSNGSLGTGTKPITGGISVLPQNIGTGQGVHKIVVNSSGTVYTWGRNDNGQLGDSTKTDGPSPIAVQGVLTSKTITDVSLGGKMSIALASDGTVYTWGDNQFGQLGNNSTTESLVPVAVDMTVALAGKTITAVAAGNTHCIALDSDGKVYTWGRNIFGALGDNTTSDSHVPVAVSGVLAGKTITAIAAGFYHNIALASDGTLYTWGYNNKGQLGNGTNGTGTDSKIPVAVSGLAGLTIKAIAAGYYHSMAIASDGTVYTWGYNPYGQLGNGTNGTGTDSNVPAAISVAGKNIIGIAGGNFHSMALASDGTVYTWGQGSKGQLGNAAGDNSNVPVAVYTSGVLSGKLIKKIASSQYGCMALASDGSLYTWGLNQYGGLGIGTSGTETNSFVPVLVDQSEIGALPVELTSFTASSIENGIKLNWETATEVNNYGFEIERSSVISSEQSESRNLSWEVVGFIEGHGNSNSPKEYTFIDEKTSEVFENLGGLDAVLKYRLKQIDFDGKFEYSEIITVGTENFLSMPMEYALEQNYPNPFNPTTSIEYSVPNVVTRRGVSVQLKIYDMLGNEVATLVNEQKSAGNYKVNFDASNLASGIYFYKINTSSGFTSTKKLILMK